MQTKFGKKYCILESLCTVHIHDITRELLIQWNQFPYTGDSLVALSGGIMSLERHAFLSSWMPLFYVSISVCMVSTFMVN